MIAINFNNPDKAKVSRNLIVALNDELKSLIEYWTDDDDKETNKDKES
jgi:hypothetical protein